MTKSKEEEHIKEYYEKFKRLGLQYETPKGEAPYPTRYQRAYYYRVNLNAIEEFKKVGIDLVKCSKNEFYADQTSLREKVLSYPVIVIATVKDSISPVSPRCNYNSKYVFKIDEFLTGEYLYEKKPEYLKVYFWGGYSFVDGVKYAHDNHADELLIGRTRLFGVGDKVILFLDRYNIDTEIYDTKGLPVDIKENNVFITDDCVAREIFNNKIAIRINPTKEHYRADPDNKLQDINEVKKIIRQIDKINNPQNFYQRRYK